MKDLTVSVGDFGGIESGTYDADGVHWTWSGVTGWFDGPPARTSFKARPHWRGAFSAPVYGDARVVACNLRLGIDNESSRAALETARGRAQAILLNGPELLTVDARGGQTQASVQLSDATTCDPVGGSAYDISFQFTAVDPIRYGTVVHRAGVDLAKPAASGLNFGAGGANLLANPGFEYNNDPWTVAGGAFWYGFGAGRGGSPGVHSAAIVPDGTSAQCQLLSDMITLGDGSKVHVAAWVNLSATTDWYSTSVNWFDASGTFISTSYNNVQVTGHSWTYVENTFTVPSGAAMAVLLPTLAGTPSTEKWYVDDCLFEMAEAAGLDFVTGGGLDFGGGARDTQMYLTNTGTAIVYPTFTLATPVSQPVLTNGDNGGRLEYLGDIAPAQSLTIDCANKRVMLSGVSRRNRMGRADFESFGIPPGGTLRVFFQSLTYPTAGAHVDVQWRDGWW